MIQYLQQNQFVALLVALPITIICNIVAGAILANFKGEFSFKVFMVGVIKGVLLYAIFGAMIFVSMIVVFAEIDIPMVARAIMYVVTLRYVIDVFNKVKAIMGYDASKAIIEEYKEGTE